MASERSGAGDSMKCWRGGGRRLRTMGCAGSEGLMVELSVKLHLLLGIARGELERSAVCSGSTVGEVMMARMGVPAAFWLWACFSKASMESERRTKSFMRKQC